MSRAWIPFYIGDYLKDKDSMPHDGSSRAAVARVPLPRWRKISAPIDAFFAADGTNKRPTAEISKAETVGPKRAIAGAADGRRSGLSKAIARGQQGNMQRRPDPRASPSPRPAWTSRHDRWPAITPDLVGN
jgi:uncharacterized protein YdaU (DUF1376 family)